jgi:hypothetical protein
VDSARDAPHEELKRSLMLVLADDIHCDLVGQEGRAGSERNEVGVDVELDPERAATERSAIPAAGEAGSRDRGTVSRPKLGRQLAEARRVVTRQIPHGVAADADAHRAGVVGIGRLQLERGRDEAVSGPRPRPPAGDGFERIDVRGFADHFLRAAGLDRGPLEPRRRRRRVVR